MKNVFFKILAFLAVVEVICSTGAFAIELQVGQSKEYSRIVDAMYASREGDIIKVWPGIYNEKIGFRSGVTLEGVDSSSVIINGYIALADAVMLKNVTLNVDRLTDCGILAEGVKNIKLVGIKVTGGGYYYGLLKCLVYVRGSRNILIYDSELNAEDANCLVFEDNCRGIFLIRTLLTSDGGYRGQAKSPLVIDSSALIKVYNCSFYKGRNYHP